jgi:antitoxin component YwqK of YwqJK toxin-antitoxin module
LSTIDNKIIISIKNFINDKINGIKKVYCETGELYFECNHIDDKLNGIKKIYYENGQLKSECNYINGKKVK